MLFSAEAIGKDLYNVPLLESNKERMKGIVKISLYL